MSTIRGTIMKKSRIALLAIIACSSFATVGCSSSPQTNDDGAVESDIQRVNFDLTSLEGADVDSLTYTLTNTTTGTVKTGLLDVSFDDSLELSLLLRPGNYSISFSGTGTYEGDDVPCAGSEDFAVVVGSNPTVEVDIVCEAGTVTTITQPSVGEVEVSANLTVNREVVSGECGFTSALIGPLTAVVGHPIVTDSEFVSAGTPAASVTWSASAGLTGSFADVTDATTTFTCTAAGTGTITATLGGGVEGCADTVVADVTCVGAALPAVCGNGVVESGEVCDDGDPSSNVCNDACSGPVVVTPVCGNGTIEGTEACDDGNSDNTDACLNDCTLPVPASCGNSVVESGEECEPPNTVTCNAACQTIACGDGIVEGAEVCDDGDPADPECNDACTGPDAPPVDNGADCQACLAANELAQSSGVGAFNDEVCSADPLCVASRLCIDTSGCMADGDDTDCYCGAGVTTSACVVPTFVPQGPCAAEIIEGSAAGNTNEQNLQFLYAAETSSGAAYNIMSFVRSSSICLAECL
jgi:cysteine-rich repeat protein